jgi:hypothetical protein
LGSKRKMVPQVFLPLLILSLALASLAFLPTYFYYRINLPPPPLLHPSKNICFICFPSRNSFYKHQFVRSNLQDEAGIHCRPWRVRRWCCRTGNLPFWVPFLWCKLTPAFAAHVPVSRGDFLDIMARGVEVQWLCSRDGYLLVPRRLCLLSIDCAFSRRVAQCFNCFATLFNTSPSLQKLPSSFLLVQWRSSIERRLLLVSTRH